jgi:hypothetical protein
MKFKNTMVFLAIGALFIGTVFFSGCTELEGIVGELDSDSDDDTPSENSEVSCSSFCSSKGYAAGQCVNSGDLDSSSYDCSGTKCAYNIKVFDKEDNNIKCEEDSCACWDRETCGDEASECELRCRENGCSEDIKCNTICKNEGYEYGLCHSEENTESSGCSQKPGDQIKCQYIAYSRDTSRWNYGNLICEDSSKSFCCCFSRDPCGATVDECIAKCTGDGCTG